MTIDPNTPEAIAQRQAEHAELVKKAKRDIAIILACHEDRIDHFKEEDEPDISPRFEAVIYPVYIGIWLYQLGDDKRWAVEVDEVQNETNWLEDGVQRADTIQHAAFHSFQDALGAANSIILHLSDLSTFNEI